MIIEPDLVIVELIRRICMKMERPSRHYYVPDSWCICDWTLGLYLQGTSIHSSQSFAGQLMGDQHDTGEKVLLDK